MGDDTNVVIEILRGNADCFHSPRRNWLGVVVIFSYCPWKAGLLACTTVNALKRIVLYLPVFQTNFYSGGWAYPGAIATQITFIAIKIY
jgi:hypothetical protein